eukprot:scaffold711241_cov59-Attheya_sp.AAC.2
MAFPLLSIHRVPQDRPNHQNYIPCMVQTFSVNRLLIWERLVGVVEASCSREADVFARHRARHRTGHSLPVP